MAEKALEEAYAFRCRWVGPQAGCERSRQDSGHCFVSWLLLMSAARFRNTSESPSWRCCVA